MAWKYHGSGAMGARPENRISVGLPRHPWQHSFLSKSIAQSLSKNLRAAQRILGSQYSRPVLDVFVTNGLIHSFGSFVVPRVFIPAAGRAAI